MTYEQWFEDFGQWLASERAPNGDFQVQIDLLPELIDRLRLQYDGNRALVTPPGAALSGARRMELLGAFLDAARAELDRIEAVAAVRTYRSSPQESELQPVDPRPWYRRFR